ncbi:hypothetical protein IT072_13900 [Leifsonia sp. ZF2019]|uniref:hypothetical protein n=1 Tax=Leifsonia sp. ZF2019 TaxID=2781978 RepID=UPI001CBDEF87|nr:hypothetical protein [Leifsonia sp. ZF2019]UAJ78351.1 hypothetical protein IT072_13900 [Leifsonia sp. ZF2019]
MNKLKTNLDRVRAAKERVETTLAGIPSTAKAHPFVDAQRAVLNADLNDRRTGITRETETTPGLTLAVDVLAGAR